MQTAHKLKALILEAQAQDTGAPLLASEALTDGSGRDGESCVMSLRSCYFVSHGAEPQCTNWTRDFVGCVATYCLRVCPTTALTSPADCS